ncbi:MAG TPA: hypothetical protein VG963_29445 [Polyangiaceae bacterium]|nr:hypothetical protein [Polyangiaceae bacterium]
MKATHRLTRSPAGRAAELLALLNAEAGACNPLYAASPEHRRALSGVPCLRGKQTSCAARPPDRLAL